MRGNRASRYSRYDPDRRSRSPRDRSPDRFGPYDQDRRRSSAESRPGQGQFTPGRDGFGDPMRRDPPRGPKALIDAPNGPRGGGFAGDFRGGRGRGRGRGWDDGRDRGRDRDIDFRDRYRDDRSRERDRDGHRDWRDSRDFRSRRSPIPRPRSPPRDFRDRERDRDGPLPTDIDRPRRNSRDGPLSAGSSNSDPQFGLPPFSRGGGYVRGRGRGRGDWQSDRGRGRMSYDDRNDRYPRSRSQEGRWGRDRDDRERNDRFQDPDMRRDPRDDRDRNDRDMFRPKLDTRASIASESASQSREVSPPPIAPSAPAFGSVPNRAPFHADDKASRGFGERPSSAGATRESSPGSMRGPQRSMSKPWSAKDSESPVISKSQLPGSTDGPGSSGLTEPKRERSYSAEPGEITPKGEESLSSSKPETRTEKVKEEEPPKIGELPKAVPASKRKPIKIRAVRFSLPDKPSSAEAASESDDDDDMADYFDFEIQKTEKELASIPDHKLPMDMLSRYAAMSHGAMVNIVQEAESLTSLFGPVPEGVNPPLSVEEKKHGMDVDESEPTLERKIQEAAEVLKVPISAIKGDALEIAAASAGVDEDKPMGEMPAVGALKANTLVDDKLAAEQIATEDEGLSTPLPEKTEPESKPPSTPSQVPDEDDTESEDDVFLDVAAVRQYMATPKVDTLPEFNTQSWDKDPDFLETLATDPIVDEFVAEHLEKVHIGKESGEKQAKQHYADKYLEYLDFTISDDPIAIKNRERYGVSVPPPEPKEVATPEPKPEGRTSGRRFASERDLERVLQASMREDEERKERELRMQKEKYRSEKEAVIPDMYWTEEERQIEQFVDRTGYVPQDRLVSAWHVLAPIDNFTQEETALFEKRYLENPKQWGRIADAVPDRDFGTCIQYYYMMKKDLNLKEKLRKQPKRRKKGGRGKQRSSALMSELGNPDPEDDNQETGENGERRRPRRAAAPTWGFEQPAADTDGTPASTPGRRAAGDKPDGRRGRRKQPKDKDAKGSKGQTPVPTPSGKEKGAKGSRSTSRMQSVEFQPPPPSDGHLQAPFEQTVPPGIQPPFSVQPHPMAGMERQTPMHPSDVLAAPSLRPEAPAPHPSTSPYNLAQQQERKAPTSASSYWSVSESNDFPGLLRAFGSDWTAIAAHMGSKTAVMVKNYFVRQKDQGKAEWDTYVQEADSKRMRGEKRPEPPHPTTAGRTRRYDGPPIPTGNRPLAVAPSADGGDPNMDPGRGQPYGTYPVPIAKAPGQQPMAPGAQPPMGLQHPGQQAPPPSAHQAGSPHMQPRAPLQAYGYERDRDPNQRGAVAPKVGMVPELREQRPPPPHSDPLMDRQRAEMERERAIRAQQEAEMAAQQQQGYEPYGHRPQSSMGQGRGYAPGPPGPAGRGLLGDPGRAQSPQPMGQRPMSAVPPPREQYPPPMSQSGTPIPRGGPSQAPEPRKTSNIMSLLNDDPPAAPKTATPPPSGLGRPPPPPPGPSQVRRDGDPAHYSPYGRSTPGGASVMPALKPSYAGSPRQQAMGTPRMGGEPPLADRDYYRQHAYPPGQQGSSTNSPQTQPRYPAPSQSPYQPNAGYPAPSPYGAGQPPSMAGSPPPQYGTPRGGGRDSGGRDGAWPPPPGSKHSPAQAPPQPWSPAPPSQLGMRDDRGYAANMQGRYAPPPLPPSSRGPEPPTGQAYNRYSSTPVQSRDPREPPGRSYTPVGYDGRGPPPPPPPQGPGGPGYPVDPRDPRDLRDPRDPRGLRPTYDRPPDRYGR